MKQVMPIGYYDNVIVPRARVHLHNINASELGHRKLEKKFNIKL